MYRDDLSRRNRRCKPSAARRSCRWCNGAARKAA